MYIITVHCPTVSDLIEVALFAHESGFNVVVDEPAAPKRSAFDPAFDAWLVVDCPTCQQPKGRPCQTGSGHDTKAHVARRRLFHSTLAMSAVGRPLCRHCGTMIHIEGDTWFHADRYSTCSNDRGSWAGTHAEPQVEAVPVEADLERLLDDDQMLS